MMAHMMPRPEHPEPMMERKTWQNLNGEWLFEIDNGCSGEARGLYAATAGAQYSKKILVPFCPESKLSGIEYTDFINAAWYKRKVVLTEQQLSGRVLMHFGAVDYLTTLYVNGKKVGIHYGGYSSFTMDMTAFIKVGENDLTVSVLDDVRSNKQPGGKQSHDYASAGCMYTRTTGIWQTVWIEFVPNGYIESAKYYSDIEEGAFDVELLLSKPGLVTVVATYEGTEMGRAEKTAHGTSVRLHLPLKEKHLWEVGNGRLYDLELRLESSGDTDIVKSYAGLREVRIDGFKVRINGKSVFQRTVLDQGFNPDGIYTAPTDQALKRDIELSLAVGFNGARLHEKIFEARFLYYCDKLGYLVWGEHANWGLDITTADGFMAFMPEWAEAIKRDFNHPSIIGWCPFNEVWNIGNSPIGKRTLTAIYDLTKQLDPTRPVIDTSGGYHAVTDIYDQHDYDQNPDSFRKSYINYNGKEESFAFSYKGKQTYLPDLPLFLSEYGGIKWVPVEYREKQQENAWGYGNEPTTEEEYFDRYERLTAALLENPNLMGFCYTQLTDVEQEVNGIYLYNREKKFESYERIYNANTKKAAIEEES